MSQVLKHIHITSNIVVGFENVQHTCAINWMILTKILSGMSRGTTLRLPLGKRVEVMDVRRLWAMHKAGKVLQICKKKFKFTSRKRYRCIVFTLYYVGEKKHIAMSPLSRCIVWMRIWSPLCRSVALALDSDHVNPQQAVERLQSHAGHLGVFILHSHTIQQSPKKKIQGHK